MESFSIFVVRPELVHFAGNQIQFDFCAHYTHRALQKPLLFFLAKHHCRFALYVCSCGSGGGALCRYCSLINRICRNCILELR